MDAPDAPQAIDVRVATKHHHLVARHDVGGQAHHRLVVEAALVDHDLVKPNGGLSSVLLPERLEDTLPCPSLSLGVVVPAHSSRGAGVHSQACEGGGCSGGKASHQAWEMKKSTSPICAGCERA